MTSSTNSGTESESEIQVTLVGGIGGLHKAGAGVVRVTRIITRLSPWRPDRHHPLRLALSCRYRQSATLLWTLHSGGRLARPQSAARIARSDDAGDGESSRRCLTAAGASRRAAILILAFRFVRRVSLRPPPIGYPAFVVLLVPAALFFDCGFSNVAPYSAELFPVRLSARGVGLAQAANGVGKIAGPLCLALIAGTSNLTTPKATIEAVTPALLFLAACGLAIGLAFTLFGVETHGRPLALEAAGQGTSSQSADWAGTVTVGLGRKSEAVAAHLTVS